MSPENEALQCHHDTNNLKEGDSNDTSVKSDETEEAHETGSRDEQLEAEARDSGREGEEKIRSIDISSANLYIYMEIK
jgi:hypothetical protein